MKIFKSKTNLYLIFALAGMISAFYFCSVGKEVFAEEYSGEYSQLGTAIVETALMLEEAHPERIPGTSGESETADTLALLLEEGGFDPLYSDYLQEFLYTPIYNTTNSATITTKSSANVIGTINNNKEQTIIIGANYDSYFYDGEDGNTGFYSNLLGVATAYQIALELSEVEDLPYNIIIAFWGAKEDGFCGSEYFLSSLTNAEISTIALYVNLDGLGVGDNIYIFTNEVADSHEDAFVQTAEELGIELYQAPEDKGYTLPVLTERPYMHAGINSDNFYFMTEEVMCANFFSGVWGDGEFSYETALSDSILYTQNDNSEYIFSVHTREEIESEVASVSAIVLQTLTDEDILTVLAESKESSFGFEIFYDDSFITIVSLIILGGFVALFFVFRNKLKKEVKDESANTVEFHERQNIEVFGETVILEDGVVKRETDVYSDPYKDESPFDF